MSTKEKYNFEDDNKTSGFHLPTNYFNLFNQQLAKRLELQEELKEFPNLLSLTKENPFYVCEAYFDELPVLIATKIHSKNKNSTWIEKIKLKLFQPSFILSYSLIALLIAVSVYIYTYQNSNLQACDDLACLSKEELMNNNEFNNLTTEDIINEIPETDFHQATDTSLHQAMMNELIENATIFTTIEEI